MHGSEIDQAQRARLVSALQRNWRVEMEGAATYRRLAERERDDRKKKILLRLAEGEEQHAERWANRLRELGTPVTEQAPRSAEWLDETHTLEAALRLLENEEESHIAAYQQQARELNDRASNTLIAEMVNDERNHARILQSMGRGETMTPRQRLDSLLKREHWHTSTGSWFGDAIYGANDGLGAVFGIVSGVAGATNGGDFVKLAGLAGAIASALSMGSGAYLATKSEGEVHRAEIKRERREMEESPEEEREELELFYQLKGLSPDESKLVAERLSQDPETFLSALAQEELGISEERIPNPWLSALSSSAATFIGAMIPVIPFFFLSGLTAVIVAAAVSLIAHFLVGASKTFVTGRSWITSGAEMTFVGAIEGAITFALGTLISPIAPHG